jgi:hypothetical protein
MGNTEPGIEHPGFCLVVQGFCQSLVRTENIDELIKLAEVIIGVAPAV